MKCENDIVFLVTGGAGFIGSNLCKELLSRGYKVKCLDNFSSGKKENIVELMDNPNFELFIGDIRDFNICDKTSNNVDYILHQAAIGSVPRSIKEPCIYEEVNIRGTLNIFEAARKNNVKRVVFASSSSVYGDIKKLPQKEGEEGQVISPYALTKKVTEEYGDLYNRIYGLETIGLRYFNVFGKIQCKDGEYAAVIPKFITTLLKGGKARINGDGTQSRDFTYIDDVVEANIKACFASKDAVGRVYNISVGGREQIIDVYEKIKKYLGIDREAEFVEMRAGDIKNSNANIENAKKMLGYNPKYPFQEGIKLTINWYKEVLNK